MSLPLSVIYLFVFLFGTIIGSFLNVVIYRLHTGRSVNNRSHCLSCGTTLQWYELVPLFSYLLLRGRCRQCGAFIPIQYVLVELVTGLGFLLIAWHTMSPIAWPLLAVIVATLLVITVYDLRHLIIPDSLVLVLVVAAIGLLGHEVYLSGAIMLLPQALLAGGLASLVYWSLWRVSAGRWIGFGDVKLAFPLGMLVGLSGVLSLVVWSFWLGAIISVALLTGQYLMRRGKRPLRILAEPLTMKSEVPFAPFLVLAFLLVYFGQADVVALTGYALNLLLT